MQLRSVEDLDLENKSVLLRLDLNVPLENGVITDDTRIQAALPTIRYILERTNKLAICSHLGRPTAAREKKFSLEPVGAKLAEILGREVVFIEDYYEESCEQVLKQLDANQFILLENLRFHEGEKKNDLGFAQKLAEPFDFYVNDAFGAAHRAHASVVASAELFSKDQRASGFLIQKEVRALEELLRNTTDSFTVVMGGAKVSDKISVILNLMNKCNTLLVGGAMAYTFLKYRGIKVGASRVEEEKLDLIGSIFRNAEASKVRIELPCDHVCATEFKKDAEVILAKDASIPAQLMGLDIGPETIKNYSRIIKGSKTVFWNGPMGVFEWPSFAKGTESIAFAMAESPAKTIVGGGDSVSAVNKVGVANKMSHISTGGGASLEFLEGKILPGLRVLYK